MDIDVGGIVRQSGVNLRRLAEASGVDYNTIKGISSGRVPGTSKRLALARGLRLLADGYRDAADKLDPASAGGAGGESADGVSLQSGAANDPH